MSSVTVLYLAGWGRSGSTVVSGVLAALDGVEAVGEIRSMHGLGWGIGIRCSCGEPLRECSHWESILDRAYGPSDDRKPFMISVARLHDRVTRLRGLRRLISGGLDETALAELRTYQGHLEPLYRAIADEAGAGIIVDSSKHPGYAAALAGLPSIDLRVVHLVRDPRAVAHSWQRTRVHPDFPDEREMTRYRPWESTLQWDIWNWGTDALARTGVPTLRLRYEDFVADPRSSLSGVLRHAGLTGSELGDEIVSAGPGHQVHGNPGRHSGRVEIREDSAWRTEMRALDGVQATLVGLPLLRRYGYPLTWR